MPIEHVVVLMMENRSFDHLLGYLRSPDYPIEGLVGNELNTDSNGRIFQVNPNAQYSGDLTHDPHHEFEDVMEQIFGTKTPEPGQQADMSGFVRNYARYAGANAAGNVMNCFSPARLPVLSTLAREYAICDHWFSSVPGPTLPNRLFAHAGTSRGRLDMLPLYFKGFYTVYEELDKNGIDATIYYHDWSAALSFEYLLLHNQQMFFAEFDRFAEHCRKNELPAYSFIEPRYHPDDSQGPHLPANDQHPDNDVAAGDWLIKEVYQAIRSNNDVWKNTLFIIVYDEHGGIYDHVQPPACVSPDGMVCPAPKFDFTMLGVRVPAVIVSPYIPRGTIDSRLYDHTSLIATAMKLLAPQGVWPNDHLGQRAKQANTCDSRLDFNQAPRMEFPDFSAATRPQPGPAQQNVALSSLQHDAVTHAADLNQSLPPEHQIYADPSAIHDAVSAGQFVKSVATAAQNYGKELRDGQN